MHPARPVGQRLPRVAVRSPGAERYTLPCRRERGKRGAWTAAGVSRTGGMIRQELTVDRPQPGVRGLGRGAGSAHRAAAGALMRAPFGLGDEEALRGLVEEPHLVIAGGSSTEQAGHGALVVVHLDATLPPPAGSEQPVTRWCTGAGAPSPGGCRCAEGGTPDPCHRDHPARPGGKLEPPQPPGVHRAIPAGRRRRRGGTSLTPAAVGPGGIPAGRGRFRPQDPPRCAIARLNSERPFKRSTAIFRPLWTPPDRSPNHPPDPSPDPSPDGSPNPSPDGSPWGWGIWGRRPRPVCAGQTLRGAGSRAGFARDPAPLRYVGVRLADSEPVDGPPSSAHHGRNCGRRTIEPALRPGAHSRAIPENQDAASPPFPHFIETLPVTFWP
jgi:hypothetical protein